MVLTARRYRTIRFLILPVATITIGILNSGCAGGTGEIHGGNKRLEEENEIVFIHRVASAGVVNENEALRGMLLMLDGKDECGDFSERIEKLASRGVVDKSWSFNADGTLTRGRMANMVCRACRIQGGWMMRLAGPTDRYCLRELMYKGIVINSSQSGEVSGAEFVAVLTRAKSYIETGRVVDVGPTPSGLD